MVLLKHRRSSWGRNYRFHHRCQQRMGLLFVLAVLVAFHDSFPASKSIVLAAAVDVDGEWLDLDASSENNIGSSRPGRRHEQETFQETKRSAGMLRGRAPTAEASRRQQQEAAMVDSSDSPEQAERRTLTLTLQTETCRVDGLSQQPFQGRDSPERLLVREGILPQMPTSRCGNTNRKNVILAIGDGMGYEMARAGAIARRVIDELESLGCNTTLGCPNNTAAMAAFQGRNLSYYYTEGKGSGLSFQNLIGYSQVTNSAVMLTDPLPGNHGAPAHSLLGNVGKHETGMGELKLNECGNPVDFSPKDISEGGNMILWHDDKGGMYPWHDDYYKDATGLVGSVTTPINTTSSTSVSISMGTLGNNVSDNTTGASNASDSSNSSTTDNSLSSISVFYGSPSLGNDTIISKSGNNGSTGGFDATYIMQHAVDSASAATTIATGQKVSNKMVSVNLYEEEVKTILEDAMECGMSGGVVTSVPILHATPAAFYAHSNDRTNHEKLRSSFRQVNPTLAMGTCSDKLHPSESDLESMRNGPLSSHWTLFEVKSDNTTAENFYDGIDALHPDSDHIAACLGVKKSTPFRGVDSSYTNRRCNDGSVKRASGKIVGTTSRSELCHQNKRPKEKEQLPHMARTVKEALDFLSKNDQGMFLVYEQGDIDVAAHANHMDDMLGTLLDFDDSVGEIMKFIEANGGWDKNALYVTADHDHYLTLLPHFPEVLANMLISGTSHDMTPAAYTNLNPWGTAVQAGRHDRISPDKTQIDHLKDFSTWSEEDIASVGHFWGPRGAGGNGWASHSSRPVPIYYQGDGGCIEGFQGKPYSVLGRQVEASPEKIDQVHLHACMIKTLFGY